MALYASPEELASYLQKDLDTATATLALTTASDTFAAAAGTYYATTGTTYTTLGTSCTRIRLPFRNVTAVSAVRLGGNVITGASLVKGSIYRVAGFGDSYAFPPQLLEVDLTHGYTAAPDHVKLCVLEIAGGSYEHPTPTGVAAETETIDDYSHTVKYNGTPIYPGRPWREVAAEIRGTFAA